MLRKTALFFLNLATSSENKHCYCKMTQFNMVETFLLNFCPLIWKSKWKKVWCSGLSKLQPATRVWFLILYYSFVHLCEQQTNSKLQLLQTGCVGYGRSGKQADSTWFDFIYAAHISQSRITAASWTNSIQTLGHSKPFRIKLDFELLAFLLFLFMC